MIRWPRPRLMPLTIVALAALLGVKSVAIVRAAVPAPMQGQTATGPVGPAKGDAPTARTAVGGNGPAPPDAPATAAAAAAASPAERALLLDLRKRRKQLDDREAALTTRESVLGAAEKRLAARAEELAALQARLEALEKARKERDEAHWAQLVKVYEGMKPRDAAAIFNSLDKSVLLPVLDRMKPAKAATVLAAMQPDRAREATVELARLHGEAATPPVARNNGS